MADIQCAELDCGKILRYVHHWSELLQGPSSDEWGCLGWLKEQCFVNGRYIGGYYGGEIFAIGKIGSMDNPFAHPATKKYENGELAFPQTIHGRDVIVRISKELLERRKEAVRKGFYGFKEHKRTSYDNLIGPVYCIQHASEREFKCPECYGDLLCVTREAFQNFKTLSSIHQHHFAEYALPRGVVPNPDRTQRILERAEKEIGLKVFEATAQ
jgi:hypothetical protein